VNRRILVIDDEAPIRSALGQLLEYEGYEVRTVANGADGLTEYDKFRPHLVFSDVKMAGMDGLDVLRALRTRDSRALVVMISGHATLATAVEATQAGAYDVMEKPLDTDRILVLLRNALRHLDLEEENATLLEQLDGRREIVGQSHSIVSLLERIDKVAATPARVLRKRHRQGTGRARGAPRFDPDQEALHRSELRCDPGRTDRERAVRTHARLVHWRSCGPSRQVRAG
jgi:two-component system, NtrC family, nitrogen regulation response regulator NtrX